MLSRALLASSLLLTLGVACTIEAEGSFDIASLEGSPTGGTSQGGSGGNGASAGSTTAGSAGSTAGTSGEGGTAGTGGDGGTSGSGGDGGTAGDAGSAGVGGSAGGGAGGDSGAAGSAGAAGSPPACTQPSDCGKSTKCVKYECAQGACSKILSGKGVSCDSDLDKCNGTCACDGDGNEVLKAAPQINDNDPCTNDVCEPTTGTVANLPIDGCAACNDALPCPDPGPCAKVSCEQGKCKLTPSEKDTDCGDSDKCNGDELCDGQGACLPGTPVMIDDGNACTDDLCDPASGEVKRFDVVCDAPECDFFLGKATEVSCDPQVGCKKTDVPCKAGLSCKGDEPVCATSCTPGEEIECLPGFVCKQDGASCAQKIGSVCSENGNCASGFCERSTTGQKICAELSCVGCQLVDEPGKKCVNIPNGQDPKNACSEQSKGCKSQDNCDGNGACQKKPEGDGCGFPATCQGGKCCGPAGVICDLSSAEITRAGARRDHQGRRFCRRMRSPGRRSPQEDLITRGGDPACG